MRHWIGWVACLSILMGGASAEGAAKPQTVYLQNEDGSLLGRSRYVWFTDQRVLVPVSAYEKMGLRVSRDPKRQRVRISVPNRDVGFTFEVGRRMVREPNVTTAKDGIISYERPVLQLREKEFFIAPMALKDYFEDYIETRWDRNTRTVTLQRRHDLVRLLRLMPKD